eukprot:g577.t1
MDSPEWIRKNVVAQTGDTEEIESLRVVTPILTKIGMDEEAEEDTEDMIGLPRSPSSPAHPPPRSPSSVEDLLGASMVSGHVRFRRKQFRRPDDDAIHESPPEVDSDGRKSNITADDGGSPDSSPKSSTTSMSHLSAASPTNTSDFISTSDESPFAPPCKKPPSIPLPKQEPIVSPAKQSSVKFEISARNLSSGWLTGGIDPYFRIFNGKGECLYTSEVLVKEDDPDWKVGAVPWTRLSKTGGVVVKVYDYSPKVHRHHQRCIGVARTTWEKMDLLQANGMVPLWDPRRKGKKRNNITLLSTSPKTKEGDNIQDLPHLVVRSWKICIPSKRAEKLMQKLRALKNKHAFSASASFPGALSPDVSDASEEIVISRDSLENVEGAIDGANKKFSDRRSSRRWSLSRAISRKLGRRRSNDSNRPISWSPSSTSTSAHSSPPNDVDNRAVASKIAPSSPLETLAQEKRVGHFKTSKIKPGFHHHVSVAHFSTLEGFQKRLRKAKTKSEFCTYMGHMQTTQAFLSDKVKLSILPIVPAHVMLKDLRRYPVLIDNEMHRHNTKVPPRQVFQDFRRTLLRHISERTDASHFSSAAYGARPIAVWVSQNVCENRVGGQAFNALAQIVGIDLENPRDFFLCDTKNEGGKQKMSEPSKVTVGKDSICVTKLNNLELCRQSDELGEYLFEIGLHVKTESKLDLATKEESFRLEVRFASESGTIGVEREISFALNCPKQPCPYLTCSFESAFFPPNAGISPRKPCKLSPSPRPIKPRIETGRDLLKRKERDTIHHRGRALWPSSEKRTPSSGIPKPKFFSKSASAYSTKCNKEITPPNSMSETFSANFEGKISEFETKDTKKRIASRNNEVSENEKLELVTQDKREQEEEDCASFFQFPKSRAVLWCRHPQGSQIFAKRPKPPRIVLEPQTLSEIYTCATSSTSVSPLNFFAKPTSIPSNSDAESNTFVMCSRKDTCKGKGDYDVAVPVFFETRGERNGGSSADMLATPHVGFREMIEAAKRSFVSTHPGRPSQVFSCSAIGHEEGRLSLRLECLVPQTPIRLLPIAALPLLDTALSRALRMRSSASGTGSFGYLTMTASRRLVPLLISDPTCRSVPLVGVWTVCSAGEENDDGLLWSACVHYSAASSAQERIFSASDAFLAAVFPRDASSHGELQLFECERPRTLTLEHFEWFEDVNVCHDASLSDSKIFSSMPPVLCDFKKAARSGLQRRRFEEACASVDLKILASSSFKSSSTEKHVDEPCNVEKTKTQTASKSSEDDIRSESKLPRPLDFSDSEVLSSLTSLELSEEVDDETERRLTHTLDNGKDKDALAPLHARKSTIEVERRADSKRKDIPDAGTSASKTRAQCCQSKHATFESEELDSIKRVALSLDRIRRQLISVKLKSLCDDPARSKCRSRRDRLVAWSKSRNRESSSISSAVASENDASSSGADRLDCAMPESLVVHASMILDASTKIVTPIDANLEISSVEEDASVLSSCAKDGESVDAIAIEEATEISAKIENEEITVAETIETPSESVSSISDAPKPPRSCESVCDESDNNTALHVEVCDVVSSDLDDGARVLRQYGALTFAEIHSEDDAKFEEETEELMEEIALPVGPLRTIEDAEEEGDVSLFSARDDVISNRFDESTFPTIDYSSEDGEEEMEDIDREAEDDAFMSELRKRYSVVLEVGGGEY